MEESKAPSLLDDVAEALRPILTSGLPVSPDYADERLLGLSCVVDRCDDPTSTLNRVKAAEELLREAIAQYPDERLDPAVGVLFGAAVGSKGSNLTDRRALAANKSKYDVDHFRKNIEPKIVRTLAWLIVQRTLKTSPSPAESLSPEAEQAARQLYRYAQETLLYLETFTVMAFTVAALGRLSDLPHRLGRANVENRSLYTDQAFWAFANCVTEFRAIERGVEGSRFLSESVPPIWWASKLDKPMNDHDVGLIAAALLESRDGRELARRINESSEGRGIEERWRQLLSGTEVTVDAKLDAGDREDLRTRLVVLCQFLETVFPEERRPQGEMAVAYDSIMYDMLTLVGELATHESSPEEREMVQDLICTARSHVPDHYIFGASEAPLLVP